MGAYLCYGPLGDNPEPNSRSIHTFPPLSLKKLSKAIIKYNRQICASRPPQNRGVSRGAPTDSLFFPGGGQVKLANHTVNNPGLHEKHGRYYRIRAVKGRRWPGPR